MFHSVKSRQTITPTAKVGCRQGSSAREGHCNISACRPPRRLDDPKLCKNYLLGFCPAEEFQRTKHDYGTCTLDHDDEAKAQVCSPDDELSPEIYRSSRRQRAMLGSRLHVRWESICQFSA